VDSATVAERARVHRSATLELERDAGDAGAELERDAGDELGQVDGSRHRATLRRA
jgi:hypothetical protein